MIFHFKHMVKKFFHLKKFNLFLSISTYTTVLIAQQNPVNISSSIKSPARAGEVVSVEVSVSMEDQWHIYSIHKITEGPLPSEITISGDAVGLLVLFSSLNPNMLMTQGLIQKPITMQEILSLILFFD